MFKELQWLLFLLQVSFIKPQLTDDQKCKITDSACIVRTAQRMLPYFTSGVPELGIKALDVMEIDEIKVDLSGLNVFMTDVKCKGLKAAVLEEIKFDMDKKVLKVVYNADILVSAKYVVSGRVLILPVTGEGDVTLKLKNIQVKLKMPFETRKNENGKDVIELKSVKYDYDIKGNAHFEFTNLYNGNQVASDIFHQFVNTNWKEVAQEFGHPTLQKPQKRIYEAIKAYLLAKPLETILLNN